MRAAVLVEPGRVEMRDVPVPEPGPGELVLAVEAALTCGTDLKTFRRGHPRIPLPAPMGHEVSGVVAATGAGVSFVREGDAVALVPTAPCGQCRLCRRGRDNLCPDAVGRIMLGAFAEFVRVPAHVVRANLFARPAGMGAETAAALEPLACVVHGAGRLQLTAAETVVLLGDGAIALLFLQVALAHGVRRVLVAGRHDTRLAAARALGAERAVAAEDEDLRGIVRDWTDAAGADAVIECVGTPATWQLASRLAGTAGTVLLFGGCPGGTSAAFDAYRMHYEEVDHIGAFHYGLADVRAAWALLVEQRVRIEPLVTHRRALAAFPEALALALDRRAIKVAVHP
jgi:L-iditol 2-dehydrogenase